METHQLGNLRRSCVEKLQWKHGVARSDRGGGTFKDSLRDTRFKTTEECSCTSRDEMMVGLPDTVAKVFAPNNGRILKQRYPLEKRETSAKRWQFDDSDCSWQNVKHPAPCFSQVKDNTPSQVFCSTLLDHIVAALFLSLSKQSIKFIRSLKPGYWFQEVLRFFGLFFVCYSSTGVQDEK